MSALVSSQGAAFVTETGIRSASAGGAFLTETAVNYVDLAGDLAPSVAFAADLTSGAAAAVHLVTAFTPGPDRGDFTGAVGMAFTPSTSLTFNKIGAFCGHGTPGSQQVALHKVAGTQLLAVATIDMTGGTFGQWFYVDIAPVTLDPGVQYMLRAEITAGNGYFWPDAGSPSAATLQDCSTWEAGYGFSLSDSYHFGIGYPAIYYGLDLVFAVAVGATVDLAGNLSPSVTLAADVTDIHDFAGDFAPSLTFAADLTVVPAAIGSSVWSASDAATNFMTLSNGGLTVSTAYADAYTSIRNTVSKTSGKLYVEFKANLTNAGDSPGWGFASSGADITKSLGRSDYSVGFYAGLNHSSTGFVDHYFISFGAATNDVWALAIDFTAGSIWLGQNNVWVNGSDPVAGTLPIASFTPATVGPLFAAMTLLGDAVTESWTLQATAANQKYAPPTGFVAWDGGAPPPTNYVDFAGNLGGVSQYDRLKYGLGHYSRIDAFAPVFSAVALDIVGTDEFAGNLAPVVTFAGALERLPGLAGDLAPTITFDGTLGLVVDLAGDIGPQIALEGGLGLDLPFDSSFGFTVVLEASELISHPLWEGGEPCPPPDWETTEPCPPPAWASSAPCPPPNWGPSEPPPPSLWTPVGPCDPVEWEETVE